MFKIISILFFVIIVGVILFWITPTNKSDLYVITGNKNKFSEIKKVLSIVKQLDIDLVEIQEVDAKKVIEAKLLEALKYKKGEFIVEDTSLYISALNDLPGPLIKWFVEKLGCDGLANLIAGKKNKKAIAKTIFGYAKDKNNISFYEGVTEGKIVSPLGSNGFGFDSIFQPDGSDKTFGEMAKEEKQQFSMRVKALKKLKNDINIKTS